MVKEEDVTQSYAFKMCLNILDVIGPIVSTNKTIDDAYKSLRLLGFSSEVSKNMIEEAVNKKLKSATFKAPKKK